MMNAPLILASASPRRRDLLGQAGIEFEVRVAAVDEVPHDGESARDYVMRVARAKALAVAGDETRPVLGADTEVVLDGAILGKPVDAADAARMLRALSGRDHEVLSGIVVVQRGRCVGRLVASTVRMRAIRDDEIAAYCRTDEPWDKAGAYAVQGRASAFVEAIHGSYTGVVGLPLFETLELLRDVGVTAWR